MTARRQAQLLRLRRTLQRGALAGALLAAMAGCSSSTARPMAGEPAGVPEELVGADAASRAPLELCDAELGKTSHVHAVGNIYLAGQPQPEDLAALAQRGIKRIVSLRSADELDWDEAAAVKDAGMEFVAIPFDGAEELTDDVFIRVRKELNEHGDEPLVLHCGRANRVGAVWMVHRVLDDGVGIDAALEEAKAVGLRTPEYIEKAKDFIERNQPGAASVDVNAADPTP